MRREAFFAAAALLLALYGCDSADAQDLSEPQPAAAWSTSDTIRQLAVTSLLAVDARQTRDINRRGFREYNPWLRQASPARTRNYFLGMAVASAVVAAVLPASERAAWQTSWIVLEAAIALRNKRIGVRCEF